MYTNKKHDPKRICKERRGGGAKREGFGDAVGHCAVRRTRPSISARTAQI